ncbi:MAG TPA: hypothetical protein VFU81_21440 [Thermomicrobiales bacterium]|nr:hypothetical protein [Thermomicrobiales bacterium]
MKRKSCRTWRAAVAAATLAASLALPLALAAAQTGTPTAGPVAPRPEACAVKPRPLPLLPPGTPGAAAATPAPIAPLASPTPVTAPAGEPADAPTTAAVAATVREAVACRNAGDFRRAYALFTDAMLTRMFGSDETISPEIVAAIAEGPQHLPRADRLRIVSIGAVTLDADGRASAVVETQSHDGDFRDLLFFVKGPNGWLIDEAEQIEGAAATPVAS